ncbi:polar amino acid ABC transporter permease, partial [Lachnotalea glycerini]
YVLPLLMSNLLKAVEIDYNVQISSVMAGIVGFSVNYGCYMSEVIRSAIVSIDPGQREAGLALGFSEIQVLIKIILPPSFRNSVPVFGNYLVMMIKDTSLLACIAVSELLLRTQAYASQTFLTIEAYTLLAVVYLVISVPLSQGVKMLEKKMNKFSRS